MPPLELLDRLRAALGDRYDFDREIGAGGMGQVFLAHDRKHGRQVAFKVFRPELAFAVGIERFLREIALGARLQHPNILPVLDSGEADGLLYYVMPYVSGESLRHRLKRELQLPVEDALVIARDVADAVDYAHAAGVVHRDIKPENILLAGGRAVVADFGIARAITASGADRLTETGVAIGTPAYMSPEQAGGSSALDGRSDVYSLACVVHEMLAGEPPFTGPTPQAVIARQMHERPPSIAIIRPGVPPQAERAIIKALAKVPADRFPTATRFVEALTSPEPPPAARARASWIGAMVGAGLLAIVAWLVLRPPSVTLDPRRVIVFPLVDHSEQRLPQGTGDEVAIMIGRALEHTEPLRWYDGWVWLDEREKVDPRVLTARRAERIARDRSARFYLDGSLVRVADSATVVLRLHDAQGDSLVGQESATGLVGAEAPPQIGVRATVKLLPRLLSPGQAVDLSALTGRRPSAVVHWLQGESRYRRSQFLPALDELRQALQEDSTLALAALRAAQAASWKDSVAQARRFVDLAIREEKLLPPKQVPFAYGLRSYLTGSADSAVVQFQRALALDPDWGDAWAALGEVYTHLLPSLGVDTVNDSATQLAGSLAYDSLLEHAFSQARRNDPGFTPPLVHLAENAIRRGDLRQADDLIERLRRVEPDSTLALHLVLMSRCVRDGPQQFDWGPAVARNPLLVLSAGKTLSAVAGSPDCAVAAFRAVLRAETPSSGVAWGAVLGLHGLLLTQGRVDEAIALLDSLSARGAETAFGLYVMDEIAGFDTRGRAAAFVAGLGEPYRERGTPALWLLGTWDSYRRDAPKVERISRVLADRAQRSGERGDRLARDVVAAYVPLLAGDTSAAIGRFLRLSSTAPREELGYSMWDPLVGERWTLANLLAATHHYAAAYQVAAGFDAPAPVLNLVYLRASLELRTRMLDSLGRSSLASIYRKRLQALDRREISSVHP